MNDANEVTSATLLSRLHDKSDQEAWGAFVRRYEPYVRGYCSRQGLSPGDADEVLSAVNEALATALPRFAYDPQKGRFRAWLKTQIQWRLNDLFRKAPREGRAQGGTVALQRLDQLPAELSEEVTAVVDEYRRAFAEMAGELERRAPKSWAAFQMRKLEGLSGEQTAKALGMSVAAVYVAVNRTMDMLQREAEARGLRATSQERPSA
jgi:RNA polymerase sigma factor (sigma-70 family)